MTLVLHREADPQLLVDGLAEVLATPLADPFAEEVVVAPARGVERWLTQRLSHRLGAGPRGGDGVCAGVRFLTPASLVAMVLGREHDDPWAPSRLAWTVLAVIDDSLGEDWCATLSAHLGHGLEGEDGDLRRGRRWSVARRLAGLLASAAVQRPQLIADWREGRDTDGLGAPLPQDLRWQAELWRRVLERTDDAPPDVRLERTIAALRSGEDGLALPGRLSLFGHTRLALSELRLLEALGERRDVHLWLPQTSPALWDALTPIVADGPVPRVDDRSAEAVGHPLLAALGRDAREVQRTLATAAARDDGPKGVAPDPSTLLGWLQADLRANRAPSPEEAAARVVATGDRSVQVHACHGPVRQVEVLREVLTGLLEDDPTLEPRDILVMCPDIEDYAPLVHAGFGLADVAALPDVLGVGGADVGGAGVGGAGAPVAHPAHRLRVRLADRGAARTNPLLALAADLVRLAGGRATGGEVLDLVRSAPVRQRFALDEDDLELVAEWTAQAGVRWGLDAADRDRYRLADIAQNTWAFGLDRILTGAVVDGDTLRRVGDALALGALDGESLDSNDLDLAGRLAELIDRLRHTLERLRSSSSPADWAEALVDGVHALADVPARDVWQVTQFEREVSQIVQAASGGSSGRGVGTGLALSDIAAVLDDRLGGRPTRANFRTGTLTVCTLVPMRSVPHRVVCLVGLDDGAFPRNSTLDGDDVLARTPVTGERDPRSEDRQLLLDAVMAARETLVITYTGADPHSGHERPPAVPLGELVDATEATAALASPLVVRHPLQPFDLRNLRPGALVPGSTPFSFDALSLAGARAAATTRTAAPTMVDTRLPAPDSDTVALPDLQYFLENPARQFLLQQLGVLLPEVTEEARDGIPIDLDNLEKWGVGDRLLRDLLAGRSLPEALADEKRRGQLPPLQLVNHVVGDVPAGVADLAAAAAPLIAGDRHAVDVDVDLGDGRRLVGTLPVIDTRIVTATYSSLGPKQRLRAWTSLLALAATAPEVEWTSHVIARHRRRPTHLTYGPIDAATASATLRDLVDIRDRGLREPLLAPLKTAAAWASAALEGDDVLAQARGEWEERNKGSWTSVGEGADPAHVRLFGERRALIDLLGVPRDDERWSPSEETRLGQYALRIWAPILTGPARQVTP
ncbi:exodeoxyribonuclease V subunit gamma [Janibacter sp. G56]|uniref:exodeoxyribonuclease V subunit gamma n=1 Tax=Janibacter sp. G56 TaxID=3418717 RepID=UPI003D050E2A